jgi:hypothetical protein
MIGLIVGTAIFSICSLCCCKKVSLEQKGPTDSMKKSISSDVNFYSGVGHAALNRDSTFT